MLIHVVRIPTCHILCHGGDSEYMDTNYDHAGSNNDVSVVGKFYLFISNSSNSVHEWDEEII